MLGPAGKTVKLAASICTAVTKLCAAPESERRRPGGPVGVVVGYVLLARAPSVVRASLGLVSICVQKDAARPGESLPRLSVAFRAYARGDNRVFGLKATAPALHLEDGNSLGRSVERVIGSEMALRRETIHAD